MTPNEMLCIFWGLVVGFLIAKLWRLTMGEGKLDE